MRLVTGDAHVTIAASYRMSPTTVGCIVKGTCVGFEQRWNVPNALSAIDGNHVIIQASPNSSSLFFNYKKTFSIALMAVCDAKYKFTLVDIEDTVRHSDDSVYGNSHLRYAIRNVPSTYQDLPSFKPKQIFLCFHWRWNF